MPGYTTKFQVLPAGVQGGAFPVDMLRYDSCMPNTYKDVQLIVDYHDRMLRADMGTPSPVMLIKHHGDRNPHLTEDRWRSFGWFIVKDTVDTSKSR